MHTRLFDSDPEAGITELSHFDPATGLLHITTHQDVTDIMELAKGNFNSTKRHTKWGDGRIAATIPMVLYAQLARKHGEPYEEHQQRLRDFLNDRDNNVFRTRPGRI